MVDRHTAADVVEAVDPDLGLPVHSDVFDAIETDAGAFAAELRSDGPLVRHDWSDEDADRGEQGEEETHCQQHPDGERNVGLVPDEASVGVLRVEESPADSEEREPRPIHAAVRGFEVHGAADAGPGVLVVPPVTVATTPRHTAGSGLSGKSVREPGLTRSFRADIGPRLPARQTPPSAGPVPVAGRARSPARVEVQGTNHERGTGWPVTVRPSPRAAPAGRSRSRSPARGRPAPAVRPSCRCRAGVRSGRSRSRPGTAGPRVRSPGR